ncbi:MAG TPA: glycoside hydrolase family 71/99-like protein [Chthonomonadales bacterium]|nr:glycoside hydrolase family 71/99-like protein [Chthonomonadales bacterium]
MYLPFAALCALCAVACAASAQTPPTREAVIEETMRPYAGPSVRGVDRSTMTGKVLSGYQGWFTTPGDGSGRGWFHWGRGGFEPGNSTVDMWPDMTELGPDERYPTGFRHADGRVAEVFSSFNRNTVLRHFRWMRDHGIDGVFVQRFAVETFHTLGLRHSTTVLGHCREGANRYGRAYAVMYDLSGMGAGQMQRVKDDWKLLVDRMRITQDRAYLRHRGKPVVAIWGFGFSDGRRYTLREGIELVEFLKNDPRYGGCTVMLGVPTYWRTLNRDAVADPDLHRLIAMADVVSPWLVGRFGTPEDAARIGREVMAPDIAWCRERGLDYMPVVFPGFSWHNMRPESPLNFIPRRGGAFLWAQYVAAVRAGATMVYQAMFDEVDEATAIFKVTNDPPVGPTRFVTYEGLPPDHYLWLVGRASRMVRRADPVREQMPRRPSRARD